MARCCYEWVGITNGNVNLKIQEFTALTRPVIEELYRATPKGRRPDANHLAARVYDALDAAGAEVTIRRSEGSP